MRISFPISLDVRKSIPTVDDILTRVEQGVSENNGPKIVIGYGAPVGSMEVISADPLTEPQIDLLKTELQAQLDKAFPNYGLVVQSPKADDVDMPWCPDCRSYHATPKSKEHHAKLKCFAPYKATTWQPFSKES